MRKLHEKAPDVLEDLMKRASREFALGEMAREDFDKFCQCVEDINEIVKKQETASKNGKA